MRKIFIGSIIAISAIAYGAFIYILIEEDKKCDEHVVMEDGTEYDCRSVSSYDSGISTIRLCDGSKIRVPTLRIKRIEEKSEK